MSTNGSIVKVPCGELGRLEQWWILLLSSLVIPVFLVLILSIVDGSKWIIKRLRQRNVSETVETEEENEERSGGRGTFPGRSHGGSRSRNTNGYMRMQELVTTKIVSGKVSVLLMFLASHVSFFVYLTEVSERQPSLEKCYVNSFLDDTGAILDLLLNCFFGIHFILRFFAAHKKWAFLTELHSIIDYCTVPPGIMGVILNRSWTGLRFLRVLYFLTFPDILQFLRALKSRTALRLTQLVCTVVSALLMSAGMFHLLENTGDTFHGLARNQQNHNYWEFVYFCVVTASTVGYGDIFCITVFGRIFAAVFILSTLAVVASVIPDIFSIISNRKKYAGQYEEAKSGRRHIIVCGHINFTTALGFLKEFLHTDRGISDIKVVFLDLNEPDMEMESLLKRYFTEVEYFQGTIMKSQDLNRVRADTCDAVFIVANKQCSDPDAEDAANILRVISIKNFQSSIRIIVELMQYHNKAYLLNIPSWNWRNGDEVVCLAELKLGLIAQSCIAPGFSTLMANLFTSRSFKSLEKDSWRSEYLQGTGLEMYSETLSDSFTGLTFAETAEICLLRLDIMLVAVSLWDAREDDVTFVISPRPETVISAHAQGFFIADSAELVQRAAFFCKQCHSSISAERVASVGKCDCGKDTNGSLSPYTNHSGKPLKRYSSSELLLVPLLKAMNSPANIVELVTGIADMETQIPSEEEVVDAKFDSTGMFHWCAPRAFEEAVLDRRTAARKPFRNHVVVGLFADADSPLIGLNSFVMPLRSSNFKFDDLREVVILGNASYLEREWRNLYNFPKVTLVKGTALSRADLRAIRIQACSMCVMLTSKIPNYNDAFLMDKEAIMASLNIKAMDFQPRLTSPSRQNTASGTDPRVFGRPPVTSTSRRKVREGARIQLITDLSNDPSVQFLDPDDDDDDDDEVGFFATEPFACGTAFTASVLDSLMSMVYFNPEAFRVVRALIFGGASSELEEILAEGAGLVGGQGICERQNRSFISQGRMQDPPFNAYTHGTFGELFVGLLRDHGLLCLGLFRLLHNPAVYGLSPYSTKRYVVTKPPAVERLRDSDHVFVLKQTD